MPDSERATARDDLLRAGRRALAAGLSSPMTQVTYGAIAERVGLSATQVARISRSRARLESNVLVAVASDADAQQQLLTIWSGFANAVATGAQGAATQASVEAGLALRESSVGPISRIALWGLTQRWRPLAHHIGTRAGLLRDLLTGTAAVAMSGRGLRSIEGLSTRDVATLAMVRTMGAAATTRWEGQGPEEARRALRVGLAAVFENLLEPGDGSSDTVSPKLPASMGPIRDGGERAVVDAATELLVETGLTGPSEHLTARTVARLAGTAPGTLYNHWESIDHLRHEAEESLLHLSSERLLGALRAARHPRAVARALAAWMSVPSLMELALRRTDSRPAPQRWFAELSGHVAGTADDRGHPDPDVVAADLLGLAVGYWVHRSISPSPVALGGSVHHLLDRIVERRLGPPWVVGPVAL